MKTEDSEPVACPGLWPSIVRLAALLSIFSFHFLGLLGCRQYHLDFYAILAFCFLSGYLSSGIRRDRTFWLKKRYLSIMVPYWLVILPVLFVTLIFDYKPVTGWKTLAALAGANMFVTDPVYVISWYVTFVLLLYLYAFVESLLQRRYIVTSMVVAFILFSVFLHKPYFFVAFAIGLRLSAYNMTRGPARSFRYLKLSTVLFSIQKYGYPFFLIHGGVLLFFVQKTPLEPERILVFSFLSACILSMLLYSISQPILFRALHKGRLRTRHHAASPQAP